RSAVTVTMPDGRRYEVSYPTSLRLDSLGIRVDPPGQGTFRRGLTFGRVDNSTAANNYVLILFGACGGPGLDTQARRNHQSGPLGGRGSIRGAWCDTARGLHIS